MCVRTGVLAVVALSISLPAAAQRPPSRRAMVWEVAVSLSAGVIYRMDTMPLQNKDGNAMLEHARALAPRLGMPLPDHAALEGAEVDSMVAVQYLYDPVPHPIATYLAEKDGKPMAALFTLGALSHLAVMQMSSDSAKDLAGRLEAAALEAQLPRATWGGLVDGLRAGIPKSERIELMIALLKAVAAAVK
jgi:hypothetical protein